MNTLRISSWLWLIFVIQAVNASQDFTSQFGIQVGMTEAFNEQKKFQTNAQIIHEQKKQIESYAATILYYRKLTADLWKNNAELKALLQTAGDNSAQCGVLKKINELLQEKNSELERENRRLEQETVILSKNTSFQVGPHSWPTKPDTYDPYEFLLEKED